MKPEIARSLIDYGRALITQVTGVACGATQTTSHWAAWTAYLFATEKHTLMALESLGSRASIGGRKPDEITFVPIQALGLEATASNDWLLNPTPTPPDLATLAPGLGEAFKAHGGATETGFERFYGLMQTFASTLPCTYGEPGVSLFRQWAIVAALMACARSTNAADLPETLALVGIDFPGIQNMVYTIASRGAGKGVRGRSAFVQLLVNAVVDRLVQELDLCAANVLISAGGNALLLCGWRAELPQQLQDIATALDHILFNGDNHRLPFVGFQGELALALAYHPMPRQALFYTPGAGGESLWQEHERRLKERLTQAKQQPFAALLAENGSKTVDGFAHFFQPDPVLSARFCAVCQRPENPHLEQFVGDDEEDDGTVCPECNSFRKLAEALAKSGEYLHRSADKPTNVEAWQEVLQAVSGFWYDFVKVPQASGINWARSPDPQHFLQPNLHGLRLLATTTPRAMTGEILDNSQLAEKSPSALKRLGVLKADVDNLGQVLFESFTPRSAALTATLSETLTLFFGGWLDAICQQPAYTDKVYVLYAGGDDLLIIGTWDVIPRLAQQIATDFQRFMGNHPGIHLSAGIELVGGKEPLYAAIEAAESALGAAKAANNRAKNAISFLGNTGSWEQFKQIVGWREELVKLAQQDGLTSLNMRLQRIYQQYRQDRGLVKGIAARAREGEYHGARLHMGPWMWQLVYQLKRVLDGEVSTETRTEVGKIQRRLLQPGEMEAMGVGARWAQLLTRKKGKEN